MSILYGGEAFEDRMAGVWARVADKCAWSARSGLFAHAYILPVN